jgi:DNA-directed RNA polymerase subunit RPC12/RpoP
MNAEDVTLFRQAEQLANSGQTLLAHQMFCGLRQRYPERIEVLFWIVETTPNALEAQQTIDTIKYLQPNHPLVSRLDNFHMRKLQSGYVPVTPVLRCPYCGTVAPVLVRDKVSTAGWVVFVVLLVFVVGIVLCWVGLLIRENYYVCSRCGSRITMAG